MNVTKQIRQDLNEIINICETLLVYEKYSVITLNKKSDENRAYNVLLILKNEFKDELNEIKNSELIPF